MRARTVTCLSLAVSLALAACAGAGKNGSGFVPDAAKSTPAASPIKHVILMIQENRSFDNLFATFPGADGATSAKCHGYPNVNRKFTWPLHKGPLLAPQEAAYAYGNFVYDADASEGRYKMDGFCATAIATLGPVASDHGRFPLQYVDPAEIAPYWTLAHRYALLDHLFETMGSGSFTAHQDLVRGNTVLTPKESVSGIPDRMPWSCDAPPGTVTQLLMSNGTYKAKNGGPISGPFPCFTYTTLQDLLDAKGVSWKYYTPEYPDGDGGIWNAFAAIRHVRYGPEWTTNVTTSAPYEMQIFDDIKGGSLPAMSWVIPDGNNSDHGEEPQDNGPSWVASVVNAVGQSKYWNSTVIVVVWDDWGGWYDHVPPPTLDYYSAGPRVPGLVISPYTKAGTVDHTQYVFGSILEFVEDNFDLGHLGTTDTGVNSIANDLNFKQRPRAFAPIPAKYSERYIRSRPESLLPVDTQ